MSDKACVAVFEFVTNEACKKPPTVPEIPCSLYNDRDHKRRDLTPLIKLKGNYVIEGLKVKLLKGLCHRF